MADADIIIPVTGMYKFGKDIFFTTSTAIIPACAGSRAMGKLYHTLEVINTFLKIQFYDTLLYVLLNGRDLNGDKM